MRKKDKCQGCEDNFYNGNNPYGVTECLRLKTAKMTTVVRASNNERPPFSLKIKCFDCYHEKGYAFLKNYDKITKGPYKGQYCYAGYKSFWERKTNASNN
jgi:hypothetical protein